MSRRVAIIGHGAIGRSVVDLLQASPAGPFELAVLVRPGSRSAQERATGVRRLEDEAALRAFRPELVVEAAGAEAVRTFGEGCLAAGCSFLVSSVGALADDALRERLERRAVEGRAKLVIPSGAVGALDYLRAAGRLAETRIRYVSRKPPSAWRDELAAMGRSGTPEEPLVLFQGDARAAARRFPRNLNVAATLGLAVGDMARIEVEVVVDPAATGNTHEITVEGPAGRLAATLVNLPSPDNPKTSWIVAFSVATAVERFFSPLAFG
jgi:aspartate dehydrogenase